MSRGDTRRSGVRVRHATSSEVHVRSRLDEPPSALPTRDTASLSIGLFGIITFAASLLSVTWLPTRLDVLLALAFAGLLCLFGAIALGRE